MKSVPYVHGYAAEELARLSDSAATLESLLHRDTGYAPGTLVLEAGCGVGAQTGCLLARSPGITLVSMDLAKVSISQAKRRHDGHAAFVQADLFCPPFPPCSFDHVFLCFVLEHLADPAIALERLKALVKPGGTLTAIEGDHGSAFFYPETPEALQAWRCLQALQVECGGDGTIGRRLYSLLSQSGASSVCVQPLTVYCDSAHPEMMRGFADKTIVGMLRGIEEEVMNRRLIPPETWKKGLRDLTDLSESSNGTFCYTFFRAVAHYGTASLADIQHPA